MSYLGQRTGNPNRTSNLLLRQNVGSPSIFEKLKPQVVVCQLQ